ncbi:MAG: protein-L-isoaspartate(D-aspartate) O-methyltransferase [Candidatus Omnitrophica bacterium]|nr:protein-L-isoaspartate(D-aspartate) O-methyltransferase [Candidatus Omnitrophota bacterium]
MNLKHTLKNPFRISFFTLFALAWLACSNDAGVSGESSPDNQSTSERSTEVKKEETSSSSWIPPRTEERVNERLSMVENQIENRGVDDQRVLEAMRNVPRHWFVPLFRRGSAYEDRPLGIGGGQTISQPYIVAVMTQALELEPGDKVLEIGTGSGYQAAVLSELTPHVFTIEISERLAKEAADLFHEKGYTVIQSKAGDGYQGWEEHAPYDAIIVTCAAPYIPPALVEQLKPGGRLCIPVGETFATQQLMLIAKMEDGTTTSKNLEFVRFVPMTGEIDKQ